MPCPLEVVILAAGQGTRMRSDLPKVLHPLGGKPLLAHVTKTAFELAPSKVHVVYGHGGEAVCESLGALDVNWVEQAERLGTGHAVAQAMPNVSDEAVVLVLYGDVPLVPAETLKALIDPAKQGNLALLTVSVNDPHGYGRIVRDDDNRVVAIVEEKDATVEQRRIQEVNSGILAVPARELQRWLDRLDNNNAQGEYYLTDIVGLAVGDGSTVVTESAAREEDVLGVNDRMQLARLERDFQRRQAEALMRAGVTLIDPARFDLRGEIEAGRDVVIDANVVCEGRIKLGDGVVIGANSVLRDVEIGAGARVLPMSIIEDAYIGPGSHVGPFARVRPGTRLESSAKVGNFVEIKNSVIGEGSKINHLSYIGDTTMGRGVNIGAGTITCNYDGANKHRTIIEDDVFVGSDTQLVAPVTVGSGATIGAGSTVTRDAPPGELTLTRVPQKSVSGWKRPVKKPKV